MARTGTTIWIVLGIGAALLLAVALIYGPDLYRKGESIVAPIMELTRSEEALSQLNAELPFTEPADGLVAEERLAAFFEVRRRLIPHYQSFEIIENRIERSQQEDFETAGEVLDAVTGTFDAQIAILREEGMSPAEFRWLEFAVYDGWLDKVEQAELGGSSLANTSEMRNLTTEDLAFVDGLRQTYGPSPALDAVHERLTARLAQVDAPAAPAVEDVPPANGELFWRHRETIAELKLDEYDDMHSRLRQGSGAGVTIKIDGDKADDEN